MKLCCMVILICMFGIMGCATIPDMYAIYLNDKLESEPCVLASPEEAEYLEIPCIKGQYMNPGWMSGRDVYIPIDKIYLIVEFDSPEDFQEYSEQWFGPDEPVDEVK